jgi:multiple sugar transport system substrate-binding protein
MAQRSGPEWSRRKFLGMSALGAVGLTACGGPPAAPQVEVQVSQAVIDAAAPYRGGSVGMLSQKLYSEAANQALDRSLQSFAQATGTTVQNDLVSGDAGDMVAKMDAEVKAGTNRDLAFMNDSRFVGQLHNLGDLTDVTDVVEEMKALYGAPATEANNYCVFDGRWFAIPYHFIAAGMYLRKDLGGTARQRLGSVRPLEAALRLGCHREPLRRRQRVHRERHQHLRRVDHLQ